MEELISAGGVVIKEENGSLAVVLCGRRSPSIWALPKGTPAPGEELAATAIREVKEETGLQVSICGPITSIDYFFTRSHDGAKCHKTVHFYLMSPVGGDVSQHDKEFDEVKWFASNDAVQAMTYNDEVKVVEKGLAMVAEKNRPKRLGEGHGCAKG